jgi:hypothetical protein
VNKVERFIVSSDRKVDWIVRARKVRQD